MGFSKSMYSTGMGLIGSTGFTTSDLMIPAVPAIDMIAKIIKYFIVFSFLKFGNYIHETEMYMFILRRLPSK